MRSVFSRRGKKLNDSELQKWRLTCPYCKETFEKTIRIRVGGRDAITGKSKFRGITTTVTCPVCGNSLKTPKAE